MRQRLAVILLMVLALPGCLPAAQPSSLAARPASTIPARYEASVDPAHGKVTITPVGLTTQAAGFFVRSANAVWTPGTTTFAFDLLATNQTGGSLNTVKGLVLSTTPGSPTILPTGTSGTTAEGKPYYTYGTLANGATGSVTWQFSDPSATPFRFGFTLTRDSGVDVGPIKNKAAIVSVAAPGGTTVAAGASTTLTATAADPDADIMTYQWSAPSGGTITGTGATVTFTAPWSGGTYPVSVTADDGKGGTVASSVSLTVSPPAIVTSGLVMHLDAGDPLSYPGSGTTWTDLTGQGNDGTLTNGPTYDSANGGSLVMDGVDDHVFIPGGYTRLLKNNNTWTASAWVKATSLSNNPQIFGLGNGQLNYSDFFLGIGSNHVYFAAGGGAGYNLIQSSPTVQSNVVYHVAWVKSSATAGQTYLNGVLYGAATVGSGLGSMPNANADLRIGMFRSSGWNLQGKLYAVGFYNRVLSASEITQNFNALKARFGIP